MVFNKLMQDINKNTRVILYVSFYEIYNEKIYDLLGDKIMRPNSELF